MGNFSTGPFNSNSKANIKINDTRSRVKGFSMKSPLDGNFSAYNNSPIKYDSYKKLVDEAVPSVSGLTINSSIPLTLKPNFVTIDGEQVQGHYFDGLHMICAEMPEYEYFKVKFQFSWDNFESYFHTAPTGEHSACLFGHQDNTAYTKCSESAVIRSNPGKNSGYEKYIRIWPSQNNAGETSCTYTIGDNFLINKFIEIGNINKDSRNITISSDISTNSDSYTLSNKNIFVNKYSKKFTLGTITAENYECTRSNNTLWSNYKGNVVGDIVFYKGESEVARLIPCTYGVFSGYYCPEQNTFYSFQSCIDMIEEYSINRSYPYNQFHNNGFKVTSSSNEYLLEPATVLNQKGELVPGIYFDGLHMINADVPDYDTLRVKFEVGKNENTENGECENFHFKNWSSSNSLVNTRACLFGHQYNTDYSKSNMSAVLYYPGEGNLSVFFRDSLSRNNITGGTAATIPISRKYNFEFEISTNKYLVSGTLKIGYKFDGEDYEFIDTTRANSSITYKEFKSNKLTLGTITAEDSTCKRTNNNNWTNYVGNFLGDVVLYNNWNVEVCRLKPVKYCGQYGYYNEANNKFYALQPCIDQAAEWRKPGSQFSGTNHPYQLFHENGTYVVGKSLPNVNIIDDNYVIDYKGTKVKGWHADGKHMICATLPEYDEVKISFGTNKTGNIFNVASSFVKGSEYNNNDKVLLYGHQYNPELQKVSTSSVFSWTSSSNFRFEGRPSSNIADGYILNTYSNISQTDLPFKYSVDYKSESSDATFTMYKNDSSTAAVSGGISFNKDKYVYSTSNKFTIGTITAEDSTCKRSNNAKWTNYVGEFYGDVIFLKNGTEVARLKPSICNGQKGYYEPTQNKFYPEQECIDQAYEYYLGEKFSGSNYPYQLFNDNGYYIRSTTFNKETDAEKIYSSKYNNKTGFYHAKKNIFSEQLLIDAIHFNGWEMICANLNSQPWYGLKMKIDWEKTREFSILSQERYCLSGVMGGDNNWRVSPFNSAVFGPNRWGVRLLNGAISNADLPFPTTVASIRNYTYEIETQYYSWKWKGESLQKDTWCGFSDSNPPSRSNLPSSYLICLGTASYSGTGATNGRKNMSHLGDLKWNSFLGDIIGDIVLKWDNNQDTNVNGMGSHLYSEVNRLRPAINTDGTPGYIADSDSKFRSTQRGDITWTAIANTEDAWTSNHPVFVENGVASTLHKFTSDEASRFIAVSPKSWDYIVTDNGEIEDVEYIHFDGESGVMARVVDKDGVPRSWQGIDVTLRDDLNASQNTPIGFIYSDGFGASSKRGVLTPNINRHGLKYIQSRISYTNFKVTTVNKTSSLQFTSNDDFSTPKKVIVRNDIITIDGISSVSYVSSQAGSGTFYTEAYSPDYIENIDPSFNSLCVGFTGATDSYNTYLGDIYGDIVLYRGIGNPKVNGSLKNGRKVNYSDLTPISGNRISPAAGINRYYISPSTSKWALGTYGSSFQVPVSRTTHYCMEFSTEVNVWFLKLTSVLESVGDTATKIVVDKAITYPSSTKYYLNGSTTATTYGKNKLTFNQGDKIEVVCSEDFAIVVQVPNVTELTEDMPNPFTSEVYFKYPEWTFADYEEIARFRPGKYKGQYGYYNTNFPNIFYPLRTITNGQAFEEYKVDVETNLVSQANDKGYDLCCVNELNYKFEASSESEFIFGKLTYNNTDYYSLDSIPSTIKDYCMKYKDSSDKWHYGYLDIQTSKFYEVETRELLEDILKL